MEFPFLPGQALSCHKITAFAGLDRTFGAKLPSFSYMENLSAQAYPALKPSKPPVRVLEGQIQGMSVDDGLYYVQDGTFYIAGSPVLSGLSSAEKQLISMGARVIILPDKKWVNTVDLTSGSLEARAEAASVTVALVDEAGKGYDVTYSKDAPKDPEKGALWLTETDLLQFDGKDFLPLPTWVRLTIPGADFAPGDVVQIRGVQVPGGASLNGSHRLTRTNAKWVDMPGFCLPATQSTSAGKVTMTRQMPQLDIAFESGNRLWGCRYGVDSQGGVVNEIYASRLNDPTNWEDFSGTAADSWRVSLGNQGVFTGGISYLGQPLFFKEGSLHRIYGSYPAQFGLDSLSCRGVAKGSEHSLAVVDEVLYYVSTAGVCRYDGALPVLVSQALGDWELSYGVGGSFRGRYYLACESGQAQHLLVYTPKLGAWHRESFLEARNFAADGHRLFCRCADGIWVLGQGQQSPSWSAQTPPLTLEGFHATRFHKLDFLLRLPQGSRMEIRVSYDDGQPELLAALEGKPDALRSLSLRPRRCEQLRLYLSGQGDMELKQLGIYTRKGGKI